METVNEEVHTESVNKEVGGRSIEGEKSKKRKRKRKRKRRPKSPGETKTPVDLGYQATDQSLKKRYSFGEEEDGNGRG